ncbi:MAG: MBL fold metallo-hydrolase [Defluviitaleaceae bacterium]|nr:MBL fold metallo-hydrolase [Defluviitaleaceae bacterium]
MIQPVKSGEALMCEIEQARPGQGAAIWWLGQSGFAIKSGGTTAYIDLYLSDLLADKYRETATPHERLCAAPISGGGIRGADIVLSTHRHSDHMDRPTLVPLLANNPGARYIFPAADLGYVTSWGIDRAALLPAAVGKAVRIGDIEVVPLPAKHESFSRGEDGGYPYMSYIIKAGAVTVYHSGDSIPYPGLVQSLADHGANVLLLPINGRSNALRAKGIAGNFTMHEALCLAELSGAATLIPHHYDMFAFNTANIAEFAELAAELYPNLHCHILNCAEMKLF